MTVPAASVTVHVAASYYLYASTTHRLIPVFLLTRLARTIFVVEEGKEKEEKPVCCATIG